MELAGLEPATSWVRCSRIAEQPGTTGIVEPFEAGAHRASARSCRSFLITK
jgi:hypothetical protein